MTYTIQPQTLTAVARLRELHVARSQAAELKEFGRFTTKSESADHAAVQFRNGSVSTLTLPVKVMARWAGLLTAERVNVNLAPGVVELSNGGSQARFLTGGMLDGTEITVDAGTGSEFKMVGATADETELANIKKVLAGVRKTAKQANELRLASEKYNEAFRNLRAAADRVTAARVYLSANSIDAAIASAKSLRDAKRLSRVWTAKLRHYSPEIPVGLPLTNGDQGLLIKYAAEFALADKRGWGVKRFNAAMRATNILVDAVGQLVAERFPVTAEHLHLTHIREKFPSISAGVGIYNYDIQQYSTHRRQLRRWKSVRSELTVPYKLAATRLAKAEGKD